MVLVLVVYILVFIDANTAQTSYNVRLRIDTADSDIANIAVTICALLVPAGVFSDAAACISKLTVSADTTYR